MSKRAHVSTWLNDPKNRKAVARIVVPMGILALIAGGVQIPLVVAAGVATTASGGGDGEPLALKIVTKGIEAMIGFATEHFGSRADEQKHHDEQQERLHLNHHLLGAWLRAYANMVIIQLDGQDAVAAQKDLILEIERICTDADRLHALEPWLSRDWVKDAVKVQDIKTIRANILHPFRLHLKTENDNLLIPPNSKLYRAALAVEDLPLEDIEAELINKLIADEHARDKFLLYRSIYDGRKLADLVDALTPAQMRATLAPLGDYKPDSAEIERLSNAIDSLVEAMDPLLADLAASIEKLEVVVQKAEMVTDDYQKVVDDAQTITKDYRSVVDGLKRGKHAAEEVLANKRLKYIETQLKSTLSRKRSSLHGARYIDLGVKTIPDVVHSAVGDDGTSYPNVDEAFAASGQRLLILGGPGAGKTTSMLHLVERILSDAHPANLDSPETKLYKSTLPIPLVVNLSMFHLAESNQSRLRRLALNEEDNVRPSSVFDWLVRELDVAVKISHAVAKEWLQSGKVVVFLDGLDEVGNTRRADFARILNESFLIPFDDIPVVVCSREYEYLDLQKRIASKLTLERTVTLLPLTEHQIRSYVNQASVPLLIEAFKTDEVLHTMARTPVLLSIMVLTYSDETDAQQIVKHETVSERRLSLMRAFVEKMLKRQAQKTQGDAADVISKTSLKAKCYRFAPEKVDKYLGWLAVQMSTRMKTVCDRRELFAFLDDATTMTTTVTKLLLGSLISLVLVVPTLLAFRPPLWQVGVLAGVLLGVPLIFVPTPGGDNKNSGVLAICMVVIVGTVAYFASLTRIVGAVTPSFGTGYLGASVFTLMVLPLSIEMLFDGRETRIGAAMYYVFAVGLSFFGPWVTLCGNMNQFIVQHRNSMSGFSQWLVGTFALGEWSPFACSTIMCSSIFGFFAICQFNVIDASDIISGEERWYLLGFFVFPVTTLVVFRLAQGAAPASVSSLWLIVAALVVTANILAWMYKRGILLVAFVALIVFVDAWWRPGWGVLMAGGFGLVGACMAANQWFDLDLVENDTHLMSYDAQRKFLKLVCRTPWLVKLVTVQSWRVGALVQSFILNPILWLLVKLRRQWSGRGYMFVQYSASCMLLRSSPRELEFTHRTVRDYFALQKILPNLGSTDEKVQLTAIEALGFQGQAAIETLDDFIKKGSGSSVVAAVKSLSQIFSDEIRPIQMSLVSHKDPLVRRQVVRSSVIRGKAAKSSSFTFDLEFASAVADFTELPNTGAIAQMMPRLRASIMEHATERVVSELSHQSKALLERILLEHENDDNLIYECLLTGETFFYGPAPWVEKSLRRLAEDRGETGELALASLLSNNIDVDVELLTFFLDVVGDALIKDLILSRLVEMAPGCAPKYILDTIFSPKRKFSGQAFQAIVRATSLRALTIRCVHLLARQANAIEADSKVSVILTKSEPLDDSSIRILIAGVMKAHHRRVIDSDYDAVSVERICDILPLIPRLRPQRTRRGLEVLRLTLSWSNRRVWNRVRKEVLADKFARKRGR